MSSFDDIDLFGAAPAIGSTRDRDLDRLEQMVRGRYIDPLEQKAKDMVKNQVVQALSGMEGVTGAAIAQVVALADSQDPNDKLAFNQIVSRLNLPVNIRRMGDDYMASKRFEGALGRDSSVDVMAYRPDEGETQYSLGAQKRFPNLLGKDSSADVSARVSNMGDPEIRASFEKRFADGGEVDIFGYNLGGSVSTMMGRTPEPELPELTPAQLANIGAAFADPLGMIDITGEYPEFPAAGVSTAEMVMRGPRSPSLMENLREGDYGAAALQGVGVIPVVGGAARAIRGVAKGADRLAKAQKAGFDTETVYYHATDKFEGDAPDQEFTKILPSERGKLGPGIYLSPNPRYSETYINEKSFQDPKFGRGSRVLPVFVRGKVGTREDFGEAIESVKKNASDKTDFAVIKRQAQEKMADDGFAGFKVQDELVIFDPKNIRSVNAEFEDFDSPELLKAEGGAIDINDIDIFDDSGSYTDRLMSRVPDELGPFQIAAPIDETLRGRLKRMLSGAMGDDRAAYRRAGKLMDAADALPIVGDAGAAVDTADYLMSGSPVSAGIAALGLIPGVGGTLAKVGEGLRGAPSISSKGIPQPPKISKKEAVPLLKQQFIEEQPTIGSFDEATGKPVTEKLNRDRANAYERSIVKGPPAVFRRELFRLGNRVERQPLVERKIINPEALKGYVGVPVVGDMSARIKNPTSQPYPEDAGILSVRGVPLSRRVIPEGGFQFTADSEGAGKGWSSMAGIATKKQGNIILAADKTGKEPLGIFSAMGAESMDFTAPTLEMMIAQIPAIRIPKADIASFDKVIRDGAGKVKGRPEWVGLESPDVFNQILGEGGFDRGGAGALRIDVLAEMKKDKWKKLGFPLYDDAYETMKAQEFDEAVKNATGLSMYRADPNRGTFPELYHKSYDSSFPAKKGEEYFGGLIEGVPPEIMFPDTFKDLSQRVNKAGEPFNYQQQTGSLVMNPKLYEEYDDEKIQGIIDYLNEYAGTDYAEGGAVNVDDIDIFE